MSPTPCRWDAGAFRIGATWCAATSRTRTRRSRASSSKAALGVENPRERRWNLDAAAALGHDSKRVITGIEDARQRPVAFLFPGPGIAVRGHGA